MDAHLRTLRWITGLVTLAGALGFALWIWIRTDPSLLASPTSDAGKRLLRQYQGTVSDVFFALLITTLITLIIKIVKSKKYESKTRQGIQYQRKKESLLLFAKEHPILLLVMAAYTTAMIAGTTHLYKDLIGWYPDLVEKDLLNNFSIRSSFISETMRRTDLRMFPLAHQDLHVLSWFTVHVKTWMLFTAAQLFAIAILSARLIERINGTFSNKTPGLLQAIIVLLLFQPATGNTFFHVIYCERTLALLLIVYSHCLLEHQQTKSRSSLLKAFLVALLGIFTKDIAIILFLVPPTLELVASTFRNTPRSFREWAISNTIYFYILALIPIFCTSFVFIALIPSSYANAGIYSDPTSLTILADSRFYIFVALTGIRLFRSRRQGGKPDLLDGLNIAAFFYIIALGFFAKFDSSDYLTFPVQVIIVANIGWVWTLAIKTTCMSRLRRQQIIALALGISGLTVLVEQVTVKPSFLSLVMEMKRSQSSTQQSYEALTPIARKLRENGEGVNIIISRSSRLSYHRHMNRIPYDRLIEYYPRTGTYWVKDGIGKGDQYSPTKGDIVANVDKPIEIIKPILSGRQYATIYEYSASDEGGVITRLTK